MINENIPFKQINISVVTISDTRNKDTDKSGAFLINAIKEKNHLCRDYEIISDDSDKIIETINEKSLNQKIDVIITTGGTGLTGRDNTVHSIKSIAEIEIPGLWRTFQTTELSKNRHLYYSIFGICVFSKQNICFLSSRISFSRQRCLE
jgi:molybdenum cofactor biosynthesis protein B